MPYSLSKVPVRLANWRRKESHKPNVMNRLMSVFGSLCPERRFEPQISTACPAFIRNVAAGRNRLMDGNTP